MGKCWLGDGADVQTAASVVRPGEGCARSVSLWVTKTPGCRTSVSHKQQLNQMQQENGWKAAWAMSFLQKEHNKKKTIHDKWGSIQSQHLEEVTVLNVSPPTVWWRTAWRHAAAAAPPSWWTRAISTLTWRTASCSAVRSGSCWPWDAPCSPPSRVRSRASVGSPVCVKPRGLHTLNWFLYIHKFFFPPINHTRTVLHFISRLKWQAGPSPFGANYFSANGI